MSRRLIPYAFGAAFSSFVACGARFVFRCWQQLPYSLKSAAAGCPLAACMFNVCRGSTISGIAPGGRADFFCLFFRHFWLLWRRSGAFRPDSGGAFIYICYAYQAAGDTDSGGLVCIFCILRECTGRNQCRQAFFKGDCIGQPIYYGAAAQMRYSRLQKRKNWVFESFHKEKFF